VCLARLFKMGKLCLHCCHFTIWICNAPISRWPCVTKNKGNTFYSVHILIVGHPWIEVWFWYFLLKHDNPDSNIFFLQDFNRHLNSMALIIWTTKDQTLILISFLRVNRLFYVVNNSYPITKSPQNINSTTSTWFSFRDWTKIQGQPIQTSLLPNIPSIPKTFGTPTRQQVFFSK
jgi:hypothetical protein